jgi:hypothetical protein
VQDDEELECLGREDTLASFRRSEGEMNALRERHGASGVRWDVRSMLGVCRSRGADDLYRLIYRRLDGDGYDVDVGDVDRVE